jgi:methionine synthase I (cobalamin-dependent)
MSWWNQLVTSSSPVITDGAWGTQLQASGLQLGELPDAWNLTHPDRVLEVAKLYVDAGSDIILTNTFGASQPRQPARSPNLPLRRPKPRPRLRQYRPLR